MRLHKTWLSLAILAISVQTALADVDLGALPTDDDASRDEAQVVESQVNAGSGPTPSPVGDSVPESEIPESGYLTAGFLSLVVVGSLLTGTALAIRALRKHHKERD